MTVTSEPPGPKPPLAGLLQVKHNFLTDGKSWAVTYHILKTIAAAWSESDILAILAQIILGFTDHIIPLYGPATASENVVGQDLSSDMGLTVTTVDGTAGTATAKVTPLPINVAMHLNITSPLRYRGGRPGFNYAGLDQSDRMTASVTMWSDAAELAWNNGFGAFTGFVNDTGLPSGAFGNLVWVSYFTRGAFRPTPLAFGYGEGSGMPNPVVQQRLCSRRKRLGRGVSGE